MASNIIFQSKFNIKDIDGKKFDKVSRITSKAAEYDDLQLRIDINTEIYPMLPSDKFLFCLAHSLSAEGMDRKEVWRDVGTGKRTLADEYEYVVHGKVYRYTDKEDGSITVLVSFGGLLMALEGDGRPISGLELGQHVYALIRKTT